MSIAFRIGWALLALGVTGALPAQRVHAGDDAARAAAIVGTWEVIDDATVLRGGLRNGGSPEAAQGRAEAAVQADGSRRSLDPLRLCQAIGPVRMMARPALRLELVAAQDRVVMLFEDLSHGHLRSLYFDRGHPADYTPAFAFQGDSTARWDGATLVVDTVGFNERTWLNARLRATSGLQLSERFRLLPDGRHLEYRLTARDPDALRQPLEYRRYFVRSRQPLQQDLCTIDSDWTPAKGL